MTAVEQQQRIAAIANGLDEASLSSLFDLLRQRRKLAIGILQDKIDEYNLYEANISQYDKHIANILNIETTP